MSLGMQRHDYQVEERKIILERDPVVQLPEIRDAWVIILVQQQVLYAFFPKSRYCAFKTSGSNIQKTLVTLKADCKWHWMEFHQF